MRSKSARAVVGLGAALVLACAVLPASSAYASEEPSYTFSFQFGKAGSETGQFKEPTGVAVSTSGNLYVLDSGNNRVQEFNKKGEYIRAFGTSGNGKLSSPRSITLDSKGDVWVADPGQLKEFNPEGSWLENVGELSKVGGVAVDSKGNLWATVGGERAGVVKFLYESKNKYYAEAGGIESTNGSGEKQFKEPRGIAIGAEGNLYIVDTGNNRIAEWSVSGTEPKHIRNFGSEGSGSGQLKEPTGIAISASGDVWVADTGNNRIDEFGPTGTYIQTFGKGETSKEETEEKEKKRTNEGKLKAPQGVAIDSEGNAWVANTGFSNVQEWVK